MTLTLMKPNETAHEAAFAEAMSRLAGGVAVVTCSRDGRPWGTTVTAVASVSADPPTVLVSLGSTASSADAIAATGRFGISILEQSQQMVARYCSLPGAPKFLEPFTREARSESPMVSRALAHLDCEVVEQLEVADHTVFFGRVRDARSARSGSPLLYFHRDYHRLAVQHTRRDSRGVRP
ncbi:MAG TPA: flavin reductase family protein [Gaiellaceae bacterium]|nr:flavin reductase family protein [Gaiellaceae bacterium]